MIQGELIIKGATVTGNNGFINVEGQGNKLVLENCKVEANNASGRAINVLDGAEVTIGEGCEVTGSGCVVYVAAGSADGKAPVLNVAGKIACSDENYAIGSNGAAVNGAAVGCTVNILDGAEVTSALDSAIFMPAGGVVNVKGGLIEGQDGIYQKSGVINITGGTITGKANNAYKYSGNGSNCMGYAVAVEFCAPAYVGGMPKLNVAEGAVLVSEQKQAVIGFVKSPKCVEEAEAAELAAQNIAAGEFAVEAAQ